ncbi:hydroxyisourate hydrolase [uncultured Corynebacterium sp.]|uniref:hydroxyisourate hydrolase n=1 Tax=uncultured Corynebacterium sp. TaxID=159447 RepID=UPI0025FE3F4C|nr:hydroxyisourate hydrolase [uncultured Corynebacterium sp.]
MSLSTHVLDAATGSPAMDVPVTLTTAAGEVLARGATDADGRWSAPIGLPPAGDHRLIFDIAAYRDARGEDVFHTEAVIAFRVGGGPGPSLDDVDPSPAPPPTPDHLHLPLLLSPYSYTTYRGS